MKALLFTLLMISCVAKPDLSQGLISDKLPHPMTPLERPAYLEAVKDPEFGTLIRRITDGPDSSITRPMYSTMPAWNADESYLILWARGIGHRLYDGKTYKFIRTLDIKPRDIEHGAWHADDPDVLFYPTDFKIGNKFYRDLIKYHVSTGKKDTVRSFNDIVPSGYGFSFGVDPVWTSWDSKVFGLCDTEGHKAFNYNADTERLSAIFDSTLNLAAAPSPNGKLFYLNGKVYDFDFKYLRTLDVGNPREHASIGRLSNGEQKYFTVAFTRGLTSGIGSLVMHDLATRESQVLIGIENGWPYPPSGTFISALITKQPGWVLVSIVGFRADGQSILDNEILLVNANVGKVYRAAHHRSKARQGKWGYWGEPHAVPSPSGTRAVFASDWQDGKSVDAYVVELPSYR